MDHSKLLAKFFWRFTHLSRGEQGHETSIRGLKLCTLSRKLGRATRVSPDEEASCVLDLQALRRRVEARKLDGKQVRGRFECPQPVELRGRNWRYEGIFGECEAKAGSKGTAGKRDDREGEAGYKILLGPAGQPLTSFGLIALANFRYKGPAMHTRQPGIYTTIFVLVTSTPQSKVVPS